MLYFIPKRYVIFGISDLLLFLNSLGGLTSAAAISYLLLAIYQRVPIVMANRRKQRISNEITHLRENLGPYYQQPLALERQRSSDMSQRNRSGRGSSRNNGHSHGEEAQIWESCKSQLSEIVTGINAENDSLQDLIDMDKQVGGMESEKIPGESLKKMEQLCRTGVKYSEANIGSLRAVVEQLKILRAVVVAKEQAEAAAAGPGKRAAASRDSAAAASLYDFDGAGDSPVPSPIGGASRKHSERNRDRDRDRDRERERDNDSMPPKADSVEPQGPGAASNKSKVVFSKGDAVAFKPKAASGEQSSDWILGEVAQVLGEGKSRRYKVLDIEPDDHSKQKEYRSSASSMIAITPESQASTLKDWESGQVVLALYPNTTTFYMAEVDSMDGDGKVNLKFEGENDSTTLQQVERRFVIEYRA